MIQNPILKGFNPDPSILCVGHDYYIATSTFEWFPGVQIHHSRDLVNWQLIKRPLDRKSQLDMLGAPDSCGVWAPCLTWCDGVFYLLYTNVRSFDGPWKDTPNFMVTTTDIRGEWSEPIYLNASGFDPSLFHDDNGRKWLTNMLMDHRGGKFFGGIVLQEFDPDAAKLIGPIHHIFEGTELGCTEGPHIYKRNGYYYLLTAEGGTEYRHAVTIARSKNITGPYEVHPQNPIITCFDDPDHPLQKSGHADLVETANGKWYTSFLVSRPLTRRGRCTLGRESALEQIIWGEDNWPRLAHGGKLPRMEVPAPDVAPAPIRSASERDHFDKSELDINWQSLRVPITSEWLNLTARPGYMRLTGRESLTSLHHQSLIARRVQAHHITAACALEFQPQSFQQMAGLVCYYNSYHYHYLYITVDDQGNRILDIISCDKYQTSEPLAQKIDLPARGPVYLSANFDGARIQFAYGLEEGVWNQAGPTLDGSILSDDYVCDPDVRYRPAFTGAFVGLCCQDLSGRGITADFDWFDYREHE